MICSRLLALRPYLYNGHACDSTARKVKDSWALVVFGVVSLWPTASFDLYIRYGPNVLATAHGATREISSRLAYYLLANTPCTPEISLGLRLLIAQEHCPI